jgi:hypothetical protein
MNTSVGAANRIVTLFETSRAIWHPILDGGSEIASVSFTVK